MLFELHEKILEEEKRSQFTGNEWKLNFIWLTQEISQTHTIKVNECTYAYRHTKRSRRERCQKFCELRQRQRAAAVTIFFPAANANKCRRNPLDDKKKELALKETLYEVALEKLDRQGVEREWKQETMEIEKEMFEHKRRNQSFKHWKQSNEHATDVPKMSGAWREWESKEKKLCCLQTNKRRERIETSKWLKKEVHLGRTCSKQ